jgi:hypothetical protein
VEAQELFTAIGNFGFPIVLSWYLLLRMEQRLGLPARAEQRHCQGTEKNGIKA